VILVAPVSVQQWLLRVEIPRLQQWIGTDKAIQTGNSFPDERFHGLLITSPASWLTDRLEGHQWFPTGIPTLIDGADDLEGWARDQLQACIQPGDWDELMLGRPQQADLIRDVRVRLTKAVFQHPPNPYECCLIEAGEQDTLRQLFEVLQPVAGEDRYRYLPTPWKYFWQCWQRSGQLMWAEIARSQGQFSLYCQPVEVATPLRQVWSQQPVVLIGEALDLEASASVYRQQLGLGDLTCLKFSPDRQSELIQLYLPDGLPMPNTPRFQDALLQQVCTLLTLRTNVKGLAVLLVGDVPLKAQLGAILAAKFGSRVQVEKTVWMTKASSLRAGNSGAVIKCDPSSPTANHCDITDSFSGKSARCGSSGLLQAAALRLVSSVSPACGFERITTSDRTSPRMSGRRCPPGQSCEPPQLRASSFISP
jgi:ATP-dependent DNA helicase DinG